MARGLNLRSAKPRKSLKDKIGEATKLAKELSKTTNSKNAKEANKELIGVARLVRAGDFDGAHLLLLKKTLTDLLKVIPLASQALKESTGESRAYSYIALVNLAKEIATEIKVSGDRTIIANSIISTNIEPYLESIGQQLANSIAKLKNESQKLPERQRQQIQTGLTVLLRDHLRHLAATREAINEGVQKAFSGE